VLIQVYQGEREMAAYNKRLGTFELTGLPPAPRGIPQIEVTFDIDANGIVHVSAKDMATQKTQSMTISGGSALNKDEIDRMMREAEQHAEEDKKRREEVEVRNSAEGLVYQTEKFLKDNEDKIPADAKANVDGPLAELKAAIEANDIPGMRTATDKVAQASQALGAAMYTMAQEANAGAGAAGAADAAADTAEDDVVDAEIVDEGEQK
jgi:molecular chaperone DnaK